jgi:hypothetical protein
VGKRGKEALRVDWSEVVGTWMSKLAAWAVPRMRSNEVLVAGKCTLYSPPSYLGLEIFSPYPPYI